MSSSQGGSSAQGSPRLPRVGGVRCYWALVVPRFPRADPPSSKLELQFIHLDPVLSSHLAMQKMSMIGRGVIEFIHPAEREQARKDLANAISTDDLQGSVTRVRFARLSRVRIILGCPPEETELPQNWEKVVEDDEYLVLDLVLNWVADGLLLAFFHAIRDMDPVANNDPSRIHEGWSNFCGTSNMAEDQIEALHRNVDSRVSRPIPTRYPPTRVFQLHTTPFSPTRPGQLVFSWPPPRDPGTGSRFDGSYDADEYRGLMKGVDMDPNQLPLNPGETRTTCTSRFGARHSVTTEGVYRHIASVFLPYGSLVFACFQTSRIVELSPRSADAAFGMLPTQPMLPLPPGWHSQGQTQSQGQVAYHESSQTPLSQHGNVVSPTGGQFPPHMQVAPPEVEWRLPPPIASNSPRDIFFEQRSPPLTMPRQESFGRPDYPVPSPNHAQFPHPSMPAPISGLSTQPYNAHLSLPQVSQPPNLTSHMQASHLPQTQTLSNPPYQPLQQPLSHPPLHSQSSSRPTVVPHASDSTRRPHVPDRPYPTPTTSTSTNNDFDASTSLEARSPSEGSGHGGGVLAASVSAPANLGSSTRPLIRPPGNVECCKMCGITESPEWRRSEAGVKDLCNACGLRLARQVAKREGKQKPRRKKDKDKAG